MRQVIIASAVLPLILVVATLGAGEVLSAHANRAVGLPPVELEATSVTLDAPVRGTVSGWFVRGAPGLGAVLLLHGVRSDRRQMIGRAKFLHAAGYSVLLVDLPAHGESSGQRISYGYREAEGVKAATRYLRQTLPGERIAAIGVSLGAAAIVLSGDRPALNAVVLESMYPSIEDAVTDRLSIHFGSFGAHFAPVLLCQLPVWLGISAASLRPIDHISSLHAPVLIASGTEDQHTTVPETQRLFATAAEPKELWLVEGAAHVDLHAFDPRAYESKVSGYLFKHLRNPG
ncbi:MAG: alpha/beta fold hydrolase [Gammaproteobacteria bacterium]|nr:alpha/beta fold hydrolase [Gammaproteobacteria bacterium]